MTISAAITNLGRSVYEAVEAVFGLVFGLFRGGFLTVANLVQAVVGLVVGIVTNIVAVAGGLISFVLGNIVVLGIVAAGVYLYSQQRKTGGRTTTSSVAAGKGK